MHDRGRFRVNLMRHWKGRQLWTNRAAGVKAVRRALGAGAHLDVQAEHVGEQAGALLRFPELELRLAAGRERQRQTLARGG